MDVVLIVAVANSNNGIGKDNDLLWRLPADMKFFREQTTGFPVVTGRKNYESIPEKFRPLPNRDNIIVTRQSIEFPNAFVTSSLEAGIALAKEKNQDKIFIIGGGQIYKQCLAQGLVNKMLITWVDAEFEADTFFPEFNAEEWVSKPVLQKMSDDKNKYPFSIIEYTKK